ncbi:alpha/beta hydrolase [Sinimarinibacterium sp. CAU 1509]|uniref:alpha/beta fold hydrolase n=1 Tax=Sinimarinibacterium sp. CAU 1509 TaxID=2562283 RepID=UPI0010AD595B|nr:alpha/beta hydrolase [Sinimarinibacterium sp. CAU 1509]TJY59524.1 alpha/beta hydrolase [Sinimarinibacterium sp. CAU 1509]
MTQRKHRLLQVNGARIHAVEQGEGPLIVLVHGFPESWYSWREQIDVLAAAGYRVVAIDQRGYGRSSKFRENKAYRIKTLAADVVGVVRALGGAPAVVIGHDWGAPVAWTAAWMYPEVFRGVMGLSVPFAGRAQIALPGNPFGEQRPDDYHRVIAGPGRTFYQDYFGAQDAIIDEIESDLRGWLTGLLFSVSGDALSQAEIPADADPILVLRNSPLCIPDGARMRDAFAMPDQLPAWLSEEDLDFYVGEFERSGFGGPLAFYHNVDANWEDLAEQDRLPLTVPACFVGGEFDVGTQWGLEAIERAGERMPNLVSSHIVAGSGHWIQQERPGEINRLILEFLRALG